MTILLLWTSDQETKGPDGRTGLNTLMIMICYDRTDDANQQIEKLFQYGLPLWILFDIANVTVSFKDSVMTKNPLKIFNSSDKITTLKTWIYKKIPVAN